MKRAVIVSGREAVAECFMTNDKCFAHRPKSSAGENFICNDHSAFGFSDGSYWSEMRGLVTGLMKKLGGPEIRTSLRMLYSEVKSKAIQSGDESLD